MDITLQISSIVVIIMGICEALKKAGVPTRWIPMISVVLGIISAFFVGGVSFLSVASGVILGTGTTGLYRVVKTSILNK